MAHLEQLAHAALSGDAIGLRSLVQDWLAERPRFVDCRRPDSSDPILLAVVAGLIELLAERNHQLPPEWTNQIAAVEPPIYLVKSAQTMRRLRLLCETESPWPLRRRNLFAPPRFLEFV